MVYISTTKQISLDCVQVTLSVGSSFFLRTCYLRELNPERLVAEEVLSEVELEDLINAGLVFAAEKVAVAYLERAEHSRYLLQGKLKKKGHSESAISCALDYLESRGFLSDSRYAEAWLRNRAINHAEGKSKLLSGLLSKGVERSVAMAALEEYFQQVNQDLVLDRAIEKCVRLGKSKEAIEKYLIRKGFLYKEFKSKISSFC